LQKIKVNLGFIAASLAFLVIFAASATPIPLYDIYRKADGLNYNDLALTAVVYFIGAITALLIFGRISNHLGRKPVIFLCFALAAVSSIILLDVSSATPLILGRLLLGLACGLASSAVASYIVDKGSSLPNWVPAAVVSNSPMVGLTIGAVVSGSLVEYAPYPRELCYFVVLTALAICTVLIIFSKESVEQKPGVISSLKPKFSLPHEDKRLYPIAACTFIATWALGGFYQAYGPSIAVSQLGTHSTLMAAIVFSSYLLPCALGGPLTAGFSPANAQRYGMVVYTLAVIGILISIKFSLIESFLITSAFAGAAQGAVLTGSIRSLLADISSQERAGVLSLIYATSYAGAAIPSFIAGQLSHFMNLFQIAVFYGLLAVVACIITLMFARNPKHVEIEID
jgi:MFS family permease